MKLIFDHTNSLLFEDTPYISVEAVRENESAKFMFENGWVPFYENKKEHWYQTKSSRLKITPISKRRKKELSKIKIAEKTENLQIETPLSFKWYDDGNFEDFYFDDVFWGRVHFFENQVLYSVMNKTQDKKSYGTLSYYYLLDKFLGKFDYLYITDYFDIYKYKKNLLGFQYWNGSDWVN